MSHSVGGVRHRSLLLVAFALGVSLWLTADGARANPPAGGDATATDSAEAAPAGEGKPEVQASVTADEDKAQGEASAKADAAQDEPAEPPAPRPEMSALGDPQSSGIISLLTDEMIDGLKRRNIVAEFARFRAYSRQKLDDTAGNRMTSEVTGNCRLNWFDYLLRNPLKATPAAEQFTRELHKAIVDSDRDLDPVVVMAGEKLDLATGTLQAAKPVASPEEAIEAVRQALCHAQVAHAAAMAPLTGAEAGTLSRSLYNTLTRNGDNGHTLADRSTGRYMCDLLEKIDRKHWVTAARALAPLAHLELLARLDGLPEGEGVELDGVTGKVVRRIATPSGDIVIGGRGENTYQLDAMPNVAAVIDLGGDDVYYDGTCSIRRPVFVVIDLAGDDRYRSKLPGVQGGAVLGVSLLVDREGDDRYQGIDVAQGSCLGGAGILVDYAGDDSYVGVRRIQGQAIGGIGMLVDHSGADRYRGAMWSQGFAGPLGFAVLDDLVGDDQYFAGGLYPDSYEETPGLEGWGQGVGAGIRQVADGGVGVILDGGGDDLYEYDYLSHGGGYWLGIGLARDFGGNDRRIGATREAINGGQRMEPRFQRFSNGFGCHYAAGFLFDDAGNDIYAGTIMSVGFAWDVAIGVLCDFAGNDIYQGSDGNGAQAGLGILYDYAGDDTYRGGRQAMASPSISYHDLPYCGGNFSFVVDYGGSDSYGCGARNNNEFQRGAAGGFLIDRPKKEELEKTQTAAGETKSARPEAEADSSPVSSRSSASYSRKRTTRRR